MVTEFDYLGSDANCKKGMPCGNSCISKAKKCRKGLGTAVAAIVEHITNPDNLEKGVGSSDKEPSYKDLPPIETAKDAIAKGEAYLKDELAAYDKLNNEIDDLSAIIVNPLSSAKEAVEATFRRDEATKERTEIENKIHEKIVSGDRDQAKNLAEQMEFSKIAKKLIPSVKQTAEDFYTMSNGKGSDTLSLLTKTTKRAYAMNPENNSGTGVINIGETKSDGSIREKVLFHEMGHHVEFGNPKFAAAARDFVESRATGSEEKLSKLTGNNGYKSYEKALPDDFISPYVGKLYKNGSTEVISMGVENLHSKDAASKFINRDREHFLFTVGVLND